MHIDVFSQAHPFPIPNSSPRKFSVPSGVSLLCSGAAQSRAAHTGDSRWNWNWNVPSVQLDAAEPCRSREIHPGEPGVSHPHSNHLALLAAGDHSSADTDQLPGIHSQGQAGLEAALHPKGKGLC